MTLSWFSHCLLVIAHVTQGVFIITCTVFPGRTHVVMLPALFPESCQGLCADVVA